MVMFDGSPGSQSALLYGLALGRLQQREGNAKRFLFTCMSAH